MEKYIYLVRHAHIETAGKLIGRFDLPLSSKGIEQAHVLKRALHKTLKNDIQSSFQNIYVSPLKRARETATILLSNAGNTTENDTSGFPLGVTPTGIIPFGAEFERQALSYRNVIFEPRLVEISLGDWEGMQKKDIQLQFPELWQKRGENLANTAPPKGESFEQLQERVLPCFYEIVEGMQGDLPILIVAHQAVNRVILAHVHGIALNDLQSIAQEYASFAVIKMPEHKTANTYKAQKHLEKVKKKYKDLLILKDFGYCEPVSFCNIPNHEDTIYSFGCGDPVASANVQQGEVILDLGCGCGADCIRLARMLQNFAGGDNFANLEFFGGDNLPQAPMSANLFKQGLNKFAKSGFPKGIIPFGDGQGRQSLLNREQINCQYSENLKPFQSLVIGIDILEEMIERAQKEAKAQNIANTKFICASMEELPLEDNSVDVIISNCVVNLCYDKARVFQEAYRVLEKSKSPARALFSDVISTQELSTSLKENDKLLCACLGNVITKKAYITLLKEAGFKNIEILCEDVLSVKNIEKILHDIKYRACYSVQNDIKNQVDGASEKFENIKENEIQFSKILIRAFT